jgi:hypothetical protein
MDLAEPLVMLATSSLLDLKIYFIRREKFLHGQAEE